ncbi:hypothetical protein NFI96_004686, partial [Prochilodus magdalenae]
SPMMADDDDGGCCRMILPSRPFWISTNRGSSIICNQSKPFSWDEGVLEIFQLKQLCADGDPVKPAVLTFHLIWSTCHIALTCRGHDLSITSSCYNETCEEKEVTSPGGVTLSLSVRGSSIICNHSNPFSWKEDVLKMGKLKRLCADGGRPQVVRVGHSFSSTLTLSTGAPQGCVLSPLLYSLFTHDCVARHTSNTIFKFADDTTILGLITDGDETAYRDEVGALSEWRYHNNLSLNISRTEEMIMDHRKLQRSGHSSLFINGAGVERVSSVRFLGVHLTNDLTWSFHINKAVRSARQRLFFLPGDVYQSRCLRKIQKIRLDCSHPAHGLFTLLPSGRRYRSIQARTNSFYSQAIRFLNKLISVVSSMSHPVSAAPSADGCTTQDYMHTDRYHDCP